MTVFIVCEDYGGPEKVFANEADAKNYVKENSFTSYEEYEIE